MSLPIMPKYSIGQSVFKGEAGWSPTRIKCPDCLTTTEWCVTTPAGETFQVRCHTCNEGWHSSGYIKQYGDNPSVRGLTIGSIRLDTNDIKNPISYMCDETGVGSGTLHNENTLFLTYEEAMLYAQAQAVINAEARNMAQENDRKRKKKDMVYKLRKKHDQDA